MTTREDRIVGVPVGLAIGDALGAPVENLTGDQILRTHPHGISNYIGNPPGAVTDDTEMALVVAQAFLERGRLDLDHLTHRLVTWSRTTGTHLGPSTEPHCAD